MQPETGFQNVQQWNKEQSLTADGKKRCRNRTIHCLHAVDREEKKTKDWSGKRSRNEHLRTVSDYFRIIDKKRYDRSTEDDIDRAEYRAADQRQHGTEFHD